MLLRGLFWALLGALSAGCAAVHTADGRRIGVATPAFRSYVETVFREQNAVGTELAFALEDGTGGSDLAAAEDALLAACAELNRLAAAERDGRRLPNAERLHAARSAPECERAAAAARVALAAED